ncbi:hypothetical protein BGAL_0198g00150 [Botrytis galanthina]|uniref:Uncharacterized protein n=1 Tax=Botrytis galanthina TaxID=278940 RepID=A0A4S8QVQ1_9HELO|nr:hypothetical protein BGAL_0198g00150 [Botrytis galanthina]
MALTFQAQNSMTAAVTTSLEDALELLRKINYNVTKINALNQQMDHSGPLLACYKSKCPELAAQVTTSQTITQQTSPPLIGGCRGVVPQDQLQCYRENCREPAGHPGSSCASYPPDYQLACYKSKCDSKPETTTSVEVALQSPVGASLGQDCAGVAPEYELECFQKLCPMPGPPGFSCGSLPPQYQLDCYKKRCHEVYTSTAPAAPQKTPENDGENCAGIAPEEELECFYHNCPMPGPPGFSCASLPPQYQIDCYKKRCHEVYTLLASEPALRTPNSVQKTPSSAQQTPNAAQQSLGLDGGCISIAPEHQLECYRRDCPISGPIGYSCGTLPLDYQLQCYKAHCDNKIFIEAELPVFQTLEGGYETVAPDNQEECFQKECFKLFCATLPVQYQIQCYRQHCSIPDISELISGFGNGLGGISDGSSASGSSDDDGVNRLDGKGGLFPGVH